MLADIIKFYFIFYNNSYISLKIMNYKLDSLFQQVCIRIFPLFAAIITYLLELKSSKPSFFIPILLTWFLLTLFTSTPKETFLSTIVSFGISYSFYAIASAIVILIMALFYYNTPNFPYTILAILASTIQSIFAIVLFKIKRFKKGMPFLFTTAIINIGTIFCLILFAISIYVSLNRSYRLIKIIGLLSFIFTLAFLIHWWQAQITKSYRNTLMLRENESFRGELEEAYKENARLRAENEEQGRLIHHDNKRLAAMENTICEYLAMDFGDKEALTMKGEALRIEVQNLSRNRSDTLKEIYKAKSRHYNTGIDSLNTLLNYMDKRASEANIKFTVHNALELNDYISKQISTDDLTHLLSDLLENAIIACSQTDNPAIQLQFYESQKQFVIEVADSGIPFEAKSIANYGLSKLTTHETTGGNGIGLMDIWKIKETYGATLHIEEYETPSPFTKKISLVLNHKNLYSVKTYRADEINAISKRNDLRVYY